MFAVFVAMVLNLLGALYWGIIVVILWPLDLLLDLLERIHSKLSKGKRS